MTNLNGSVKFHCADCPQMKDTPQELLDWIGDHDLDLDIWCSRCSKLIDNITLEEAQWLKENRLGIQGICKDCGSVFFVAPEEAVWLLENDLKLFKRCSCCRQKNKEQRENKQIVLDLEAATADELREIQGAIEEVLQSSEDQGV